MSGYLDYLSKREEVQQKEIERYRQQKRQKLLKAIIELSQKYDNLKQVIVFGSFIQEHFKTSSDLDLYLENISPKEYYEIKRFIEDRINMPVDLYTQSSDTGFIKKIKKRGELIYERKNNESY